MVGSLGTWERVGSSLIGFSGWKERKTEAKLASDELLPMETPANQMMAMRTLMGWLRSRQRHFIFLALCFPFLLPFMCLTMPLFRFTKLCLRFSGRRFRSGKKGCDDRYEKNDGGCGLCRCEEGRGGEPIEVREGRLLQRYLEDQLGLVGSYHDCGDKGFGDCEGKDDDLEDKTSPLLQ